VGGHATNLIPSVYTLHLTSVTRSVFLLHTDNNPYTVSFDTISSVSRARNSSRLHVLVVALRCGLLAPPPPPTAASVCIRTFKNQDLSTRRLMTQFNTSRPGPTRWPTTAGVNRLLLPPPAPPVGTARCHERLADGRQLTASHALGLTCSASICLASRDVQASGRPLTFVFSVVVVVAGRSL
jgi:hypothetical protein